MYQLVSLTATVLASCERTSGDTSHRKDFPKSSGLVRRGVKTPKSTWKLCSACTVKKVFCLTAFANDKVFFDSFENACIKLINENAATHLANSSHKSAKPLARYSDMFLPKSSKTPDEAWLNDTLDELVKLFGCMEGKYVLHKLYAKLLAQRLVRHPSASATPMTA
ncbi:hypothetical protein HPB48_019180 [Haemaphysalis longicornis]|uniref:Cullin family profile domain-containing protein n=1 Tax=Haemaphysalis longicornis TaxID=44386 RepID=A0A9J6FTK6_HAELO|nr:hypothetical protein HPB48_019180 [Haemaphysalis longicornis]